MTPFVDVIIAIAAVLLALGFVIKSISLVRMADYKRIEEANQYDIQKKELDVLKSEAENGKMTPKQVNEALDTINDPNTYPNISIFDQIAGTLGITKQTLIWVLFGILAFSLLRG